MRINRSHWHTSVVDQAQYPACGILSHTNHCRGGCIVGASPCNRETAPSSPTLCSRGTGTAQAGLHSMGC